MQRMGIANAQDALIAIKMQAAAELTVWSYSRAVLAACCDLNSSQALMVSCCGTVFSPSRTATTSPHAEKYSARTCIAYHGISPDILALLTTFHTQHRIAP